MNQQPFQEVKPEMTNYSSKRQMQMKLNEYRQEYESLSTILKDDISGCINELYTIADDVDKFHKGATIASVVGSTAGIAGGILTIVGIALAPVTLGTSLIISGVGIGVATAGGVTGVSASIADTVNTKKKCNIVSEKIKKINIMIETLTELASNIQKLSTQIVDELKVPFMEEVSDFARLGSRGLFVAVEVGRLAQLGRISTAAARGAELAAQGARAIRAVSGVFAALFIIIDAAFLVRGSVELHRGAKTETAEEIRKIADGLLGTMHDMQENNRNLLDEIKEFTLELTW
ncbi:apolipoprotein L3-like [Aquarana catesbeiana]|uniref:apolipoprotein L3-like n=1 Tax=Aquarana catesbeiana TaxID=8400 RepID=UPI003CC9D330